MDPPWSAPPPQIKAAAILHQEGLLGLVALGGLALREPGPVASLLPRTGSLEALAAGAAAAGLSLLLLIVGRRLGPVRTLERWQAAMVAEWSFADVVAVALLSGLCEEALLRALAVPWIGLVPAALLFAALHFVPDRRLWAWPLIAFAMGIVMGLLFQRWGYPAAASAHILINLISLNRLVRRSGTSADPT